MKQNENNQTENISLFDFPATITKGQLKKRYGISYYKLRLFIGDELAEELDWSNNNCFTPDQTAKIFRQLDASRYEAYLQKSMEQDGDSRMNQAA